MNKMLFASMIFANLMLSSCTHLNSVSLTSIPAERSHKVTVERSKTIFLGFNFDNDYINDMTKELQAKCPNGRIQGLLTKDEYTSYIIVTTKRVVAEGFCIASSSSGHSAATAKSSEVK